MKNKVKWFEIIFFTLIITILMFGCDDLKTDSEIDTNLTPVADDFFVSNLTQTAGSVIAVIITPKESKSSGAITIYYDGSTSLPMGVGTYTVTFDVAETTGWNTASGLAGGTLTINPNNQNPVANDFNIGNLTQTVGAVTAVTITPQASKSNGIITIYYNGSTTLPTTAGSYTITFDVAASTGWNAVTGLSGGTLAINATNQTPVASDFDIVNLTQTVGSITAVTITPQTGKSNGAITIFYNGSTTLPTTVGTYTVTFNVTAATGWNAVNELSGGYLTINASNQNPVASDFNIGNLTQTVGAVSAVTITPQAGKSNGVITIYYDGSQTLPTTAGSYIITFDVAASTGWNTAAGLSGGTLTINTDSGIGIGIGETSVKLYLDGNLLQQGGSTTITQGTGTYTISIINGSYTNIIWYLNGNIAAQGATKTSIVLSKQTAGTYHITVEAIPVDEIKNTSSHSFVVQ